MKKSLLAVAIAALTPVAIAAPTTEEMWETIQKQQREIERLKAQTAQTDAKVEATATAVERGGNGGWASKTTLGGYGEHHFNHFEDKNDQVDAHRFVVYIGHEFTDTVRFFSEVELEHSLAGEGKPGEVELEQAFIQWDYAQNHNVTIGQFLIPVGILNETHEPDTFYGTERNNVEGRIVPTTWWETGVMLGGEVLPGLTYNLAVHSGLEIPVPPSSSAFAIRSGRQKSAEANAEDLAYTARLKYTGVRGLELAATVQQQQDVTQGALPGEDAEGTLLQAHARYTFAGVTLTGFVAQWDIDGDTFELVGADEQEGAYLEASYKITPKLGVFVRQSEWDMLAGSSTDTEIEQLTAGINYWLHERVVLKADIVNHKPPTSGSDNDGFNLGVGWSF